MRMLFIGYSLVWVALFGYSLYLAGEQRKLAREVALLKDVIGRNRA
jgi:CcmD family protein